jgi:hypothetical protein
MIDLKKSPRTMELPPNPLRTLYRRRCSVTGEGMNSGWLFEDDHDTIKYKRDVVRVIKDCAPNYGLNVEGRSDDDILQAAFELDICYWTEWEEEIGPDDECYTLHGVTLHTEADRKAYRNNLPCSDVERAAVVLADRGYHVWVIEGEGEEYGDPRLWTGKQFLCIGNIWDHKLTEAIAVEVGKRELKHYSDHYLADPDKFLGTAMNPNRWRFIGWESIHKTLPELMPKEYGAEDIPFD